MTCKSHVNTKTVHDGTFVFFRLNIDMHRHFLRLEILPGQRRQIELHAKFALTRKIWKPSTECLTEVCLFYIFLQDKYNFDHCKSPFEQKFLSRVIYQTYNSSVDTSNIYLYLGPSKKHRALGVPFKQVSRKLTPLTKICGGKGDYLRFLI